MKKVILFAMFILFGVTSFFFVKENILDKKKVEDADYVVNENTESLEDAKNGDMKLEKIQELLATEDYMNINSTEVEITSNWNKFSSAYDDIQKRKKTGNINDKNINGAMEELDKAYGLVEINDTQVAALANEFNAKMAELQAEYTAAAELYNAYANGKENTENLDLTAIAEILVKAETKISELNTKMSNLVSLSNQYKSEGKNYLAVASNIKKTAPKFEYTK